MKKDIIGVVVIIAIWSIVCIGGMLLWNCKADMFQGIFLGLAVTGIVLVASGLSSLSD